MAKKPTTLADIRRAVADYMRSEGCSCCQGSNHGEHAEALGKLLKVKKYPDCSGYDFDRYRSNRKLAVVALPQSDAATK